MNTCHDQGECLRPTPETDTEELHDPYLVRELPFCVVRIDFARRLERERDEARQAFAIATDQLVQVQGELRQAREENARLREAVKEARDCILQLLDNGHDDGCDWINYAKAPCTCGVDDGHIVLSKLQPFLTP